MPVEEEDDGHDEPPDAELLKQLKDQLPTYKYEQRTTNNPDMIECKICLLDFEPGDNMRLL